MSRQFNHHNIPSILPATHNRRFPAEQPVGGLPDEVPNGQVVPKAAPIAKESNSGTRANPTVKAVPTSSTPLVQASKEATLPVSASVSKPRPIVATVVSAKAPASSTTVPLNGLAISSPSTHPAAAQTLKSAHPSHSGNQTSASTVKASASPSAEPNGTVSIASMIGGIGGAIIGLAVISFLITFYVRKWRSKRARGEIFSSASFRRSAVLLDEKGNSAPDYLSQGTPGPRPPTMIANRLQMASDSQSTAASYSQHSDYTYGGMQHYTYSMYTQGQEAPPAFEQPYHNASKGFTTTEYSDHNNAHRQRPTSTYTTVYSEDDAYGGI